MAASVSLDSPATDTGSASHFSPVATMHVAPVRYVSRIYRVPVGEVGTSTTAPADASHIATALSAYLMPSESTSLACSPQMV